MKKNSRPNPKVKRKAANTLFQIPQPFLNQLNEFTNGGYVLIAINSLGGPCVYQKFDSNIIAMGLRKFGLEYFKTVDAVQKENIENSVVPVYDSSEDDDDFEDEDDDEDDVDPRDTPDDSNEEPPESVAP